MKRGTIVIYSKLMSPGYIEIAQTRDAELPVLGQIYTVRDYIVFPEGLWYSSKRERIYLIEIQNDPRTYKDDRGLWMELPFPCVCFTVLSEPLNEEDILQSIENQQND